MKQWIQAKHTDQVSRFCFDIPDWYGWYITRVTAMYDYKLELGAVL